MTTRTIITSQPDVACDVCERRLLRGENSDVFLAAGRRRIVCELCAPRAVHEGWRRATDGESPAILPLRPRRGRNLFDRLRQVGRPGGAPLPDEGLGGEDPLASYQQHDQGSYEQPQQDPFDLLDGIDPGDAPPARAAVQARDAVAAPAAEEPAREATPPERALAAFNASAFPRRIAGIARSLGPPAVKVRPAENAVGDVIAMLVAWELCWYRYEVDLDVDPDDVRLTAEGTELEELARDDRVGNAVADELGLLSLAD